MSGLNGRAILESAQYISPLAQLWPELAEGVDHD